MKLVFKFFTIVFSCVFFICLIRILIGAPTITFRGFIEFLSTAPTVDMPFNTFSLISEFDESGLIAGVYRFFNIFISIANVLVFAFKGLVQVILYVTWSVAFLFV